MQNKFHWHSFIGGFVIGCLAMWSFSLLNTPTDASGRGVYATYEGTIVDISKTLNRGHIDRGLGGSLFQFHIPRDLAVGYVNPQVGDHVTFDVTSIRSKNADNVNISSTGTNLNISGFSVIDNQNTTSSFSWATSGAVSGYIAYTDFTNTPVQLDITSNLSSGYMTVTGVNVPVTTVDGQCATLSIFSGGSYSGDVVSNMQCSGSAPVAQTSKSLKQ